ncbi:MAG: flagellar basal body-associated FliL family protein [Cellvibrionaceae bacterium]
MKSVMKNRVISTGLTWALVLVCTMSAGQVFAQEEGGEEPAMDESGELIGPSRVDYEFSPFVVNYDGESGRLHYMRVYITLRCANSAVQQAVRAHRHLLRNNILLALTAQTREGINSAEGRELLRGQLLQEVRSAIEKEEGLTEGIEDLLFLQFLVQ